MNASIEKLFSNENYKALEERLSHTYVTMALLERLTLLMLYYRSNIYDLEPLKARLETNRIVLKINAPNYLLKQIRYGVIMLDGKVYPVSMFDAVYNYGLRDVYLYPKSNIIIHMNSIYELLGTCIKNELTADWLPSTKNDIIKKLDQYIMFKSKL